MKAKADRASILAGGYPLFDDRVAAANPYNGKTLTIQDRWDLYFDGIKPGDLPDPL